VTGPHRGELEVTMPTGEIATLPTAKIRISVTEELA
jgi:hypothetical protein